MTCHSSMHYADLMIYGYCTQCHAIYMLGTKEDVLKRIEDLKANITKSNVEWKV